MQLPVPGVVRTRQERCPEYQSSSYGPELRGSEVASSEVSEVPAQTDQQEEQEESQLAQQRERERISSSRTRLKERLNWFSSRSRQRLRSFGSSDNLRHMRDGLMRSRDKLSSALSPVRGRIGSYQFHELEMEDGITSHGTIRAGRWQ